jgi:FAD/FMN-containing dehydrogenase
MTQLPESFLTAVSSEFPKDFLVREGAELEAYGKDWTKVFPPKPSAIAFPRTTDEVVKLVKLCVKHEIPIVPSGGRTGLAGGAVAPNGEIVLSLTRMNKMGPVDTFSQTVRVQAGAVTEAVHKHCEPHGLTWPVDFASKGSSHVGGNIATNAGGVKVIHYGMARNWVLGLQVVTMKGEVLELNGALEKNNTGADLRQIFIGSEGTLGIITEATLKLAKLPKALDVFFFSVEDIAAVFKLFHETRSHGPFQIMAFECMTHNCLEAVEEHLSLKIPVSTPGGAYVLLEIERPASPDAETILSRWLESIFEKGLVLDGTLAQSPREARELWMRREGVPESLFHKAMLHKNDISLPVSRVAEFLDEMHQMFAEKHPEIEIYTFGHIGDGNLHINTMKPAAMSKEDFLKRCHKTDQDLFTLVKQYEGSISGEHGIGLLKKDSLGFTRTPEEIAYLKALKRVFDPQNLLNPGKIFDLA